MTTQSRSLRLARDLVANPYAWPGGYPRHAVTGDGAALCCHCCDSEQQSIATTTGHDGWCLVASAINWEQPDLHCDHCGARLPSAYAEP